MAADQDPRAEELNKLKLALAIFSMHLDAFEARVKGDLVAKIKAEVQIKPDISFAIGTVSAMGLAKREDHSALALPKRRHSHQIDADSFGLS
jgi:hypothetical protein